MLLYAAAFRKPDPHRAAGELRQRHSGHAAKGTEPRPATDEGGPPADPVSGPTAQRMSKWWVISPFSFLSQMYRGSSSYGPQLSPTSPSVTRPLLRNKIKNLPPSRHRSTVSQEDRNTWFFMVWQSWRRNLLPCPPSSLSYQPRAPFDPPTEPSKFIQGLETRGRKGNLAINN